MNIASLVPVEQELGLGLRQSDPHALAPPLQGLKDNTVVRCIKVLFRLSTVVGV